MAKYVTYYRVRSGPAANRETDLSAQREAVVTFVKAGCKLIDEFIEDQGARQRRRHHFEAAIKSAKRHDATLVIPKFRRIHRIAAFVERLRDADVDFLALDMPEASLATITSIAVGAIQHRRLVSERIRASLKVAKTHGRGLGNPGIALVRPKAVQAASDKAQEQRQVMRGEVVQLRIEGRSLRAIADELNRRGIPSARGGGWHASSVRTILAEVNGESG